MRLIDCFGDEVLAVVTDKSVDFKLLPEAVELTVDQSKYLNDRLNIDRVVNIRQVHGNRVIYAESIDQAIEEADAVFTDQKNVPITVRTADCVPIFLYDQNHKVIALIHAGWQSTKKRIVESTVSALSEKINTEPQDLKIYIGPCIRKESFEVGPEFKEYFPNEYEEVDGKRYVDVVQANINQLIEQGVLRENILDCREDTFTDCNWFSYRREADKAGRMLHLMMLRG